MNNIRPQEAIFNNAEYYRTYFFPNLSRIAYTNNEWLYKSCKCNRADDHEWMIDYHGGYGNRMDGYSRAHYNKRLDEYSSG